MTDRRSLLAACALLLVACGDDASYVLVTLHSGMPLTVASIDVTIQNMNDTATPKIEPATPIEFPPDQSFTFKFGKDRRGAISVEVVAYDGSDNVLADVSDTTEIVPGGTAEMTLNLTPEPGTPDMATPEGDMAMPEDDMAMPEDDLAMPEDDLAMPEDDLGNARRKPGDESHVAAVAEVPRGT